MVLRHWTGLPLPRLLPLRGAHAPALVVPSCLLSIQAPSLRQGVGDTCLATGLLFVPRQAILLPDRFPTPRPRAPSLLWRRRAAPSPHLLLGNVVTDVCNHASQAEGMLVQRVFRSMRVSSTVLRRLAQASSSSIPYQLRYPKECCAFPEEMPWQRGFRCMRVSPTVRLAQAKSSSSPQYRL